MSISDKYLEYAAAFEETYIDGDWSRIAQYFTEDAVYAGEPEARGRDAVLNKLCNAIGSFDQRMDSRTLDFDPPTELGNTVTVSWSAAYTKAGVPDIVIEGSETAEFEGDQIKMLRDDLAPGVEQKMGDWMKSHGQSLTG